MAAATQALAERLKAGERIVCMCCCRPKPCHGNLIIDEIKRRLE
jgi:alanine-alpha-ketoisovalerate/valine-pyruvate aminotransferase